MRYILFLLLGVTALGAGQSNVDVPVPVVTDQVVGVEQFVPHSATSLEQDRALDEVHKSVEELESQDAEPIDEVPVDSVMPMMKTPIIHQRLDLETAERLALENSSILKSQKAYVAFLQAEADADNAARNPELRTQYGNRSRGSDSSSDGSSENTQSGEVALRVYLPNIYTGASEKRSALAGRDAELATFNALSWSIRCDVRQLMLDITYYDKLLKFQKDQLAIIEDTKQRVDQLKVLGEMTAFDSIDANLDYLKGVKTRESINRDLIRAAGSLMLLTGLENPSAWRINYARLSSLVSIGQLVDVESLEQIAQENRAEVLSSKHELRATKMKLSAEKRRNMPWIDFVQVGYEQDDFGASDETTWSVQAAIELPFVSAIGGSGRRMQMREVEKAEIDLQAMKSEVKNQVNEALYMLRTAIRTRMSVHEQVNPVIREVKQTIADSSDQLSQKAYLVYRIRAKLIAAEMEKLDAEYSLRCAMLNLERVVGLDL